MDNQEKNLEVARRYLESIGQEEPWDNLAFFAEDVVQVEFPNRLIPEGATRDLAALREAALRGGDGKIVRQHNYDCFDPW